MGKSSGHVQMAGGPKTDPGQAKENILKGLNQGNWISFSLSTSQVALIETFDSYHDLDGR